MTVSRKGCLDPVFIACLEEIVFNVTIVTDFFEHESSYCIQRVLAVAVLSLCSSVCPSLRHMGGSVKKGAS